MQLTGDRLIPAPPARVWAGLTDPAILQPCIPGCEAMTGSVAEGYEAVLAQKAGPLSFRVTGVVTLSDVVPGQGAHVTAAAKGGKAGAAGGEAEVRLSPEGAGTRVTYTVTARLHGRVAELGAWILTGFARRMAGQFFDRFEAALTGAAPQPPARRGGWFSAPPGGSA